jgi:hypothetical protein
MAAVGLDILETQSLSAVEGLREDAIGGGGGLAATDGREEGREMAAALEGARPEVEGGDALGTALGAALARALGAAGLEAKGAATTRFARATGLLPARPWVCRPHYSGGSL